MYKRILIYFFISYLLTGCSSEPTKTVFKNINFFDGENYVAEANVVIENNLIKGVYKSYIPKRNELVIDGLGKTIIPPLLNAHVHVWEKQYLKEALKSGVFSVLDMYNSDENANRFRQFRDSLHYAYFYSSGYGATSPGGHGTQFGLPSPTIHEYFSPKQFVEDRVKNNADYIKVIREPSMNTLSFRQTEQTIKTAKENNKLAVAHISKLADAIQLSEQNVDGLVHIWFDEQINTTQVNTLAKENIFIIPTLLVTTKSLDIYKSRKWLADSLLTKGELLQEVKKLYDSGIPLLTGSDAPNLNINFGSDIVKEMKLLAEAGIPNIEVLKSATSNVYKSFKLQKFGRLRAGKPASFTVINGNPLKDLNDLHNIESIWKEGQKLSIQ